MTDILWLLYEEYHLHSTGATTPPYQWTMCWLGTWSQLADCFMTRLGWWTSLHTTTFHVHLLALPHHVLVCGQHPLPPPPSSLKLERCRTKDRSSCRWSEAGRSGLKTSNCLPVDNLWQVHRSCYQLPLYSALYSLACGGNQGRGAGGSAAVDNLYIVPGWTGNGKQEERAPESNCRRSGACVRDGCILHPLQPPACPPDPDPENCSQSFLQTEEL